MSKRTYLLLLGLAMLTIGLLVGGNEITAPDPTPVGLPDNCGSPIHTYSNSAACSAAMGNKQLYTWTLIGGGIAVIVYRQTMPKPIRIVAPTVPPVVRRGKRRDGP